ncbi:MAG TPA: phenylacetate--CoA ligase family protein, partial [Caldimonas sp.]|nr:phenylacetate--CoA ligase family protein [Caldimonas sp.]
DLSLSTSSRGAGAAASLRRGRSALGAFLDEQGAGSVHIACHSGRRPLLGRSGKLKRVIATAR